MAKVTINNQTYKYRFGFGAMLQYERLAGQPLTMESFTDMSVVQYVTVHHSCLKAGDENYRMTMEALADAMDNPQVRKELDEAAAEELKLWREGNANAEDKKKQKEKA